MDPHQEPSHHPDESQDPINISNEGRRDGVPLFLLLRAISTISDNGPNVIDIRTLYSPLKQCDN